MATQSSSGKHDRSIIATVIFFVLFLWTVLAFMPLIALRSAYFTLKNSDDVERIKSTLGQLGTYGDMFGALNCLFSGAAMIGVAYAVLLQRRELHYQQEEIEKNRIDRAHEAVLQRRTALIQATSVLAQVQALKLTSLHGLEYSSLTPEGKEDLNHRISALWLELKDNMNILSDFVKVLASEHAQDVKDPDGRR